MIPDYQSIMLPLLLHVKDGQEYAVSDCIDFLAKKFTLTQDELNEWLPSKKQKHFTTGSIGLRLILRWPEY